MKNLNQFLILVLFLMIYSCEKEQDNGTNLNLEKVSGFVQKGPFINGTSISINELNTNLSQTGKLYSTQIADNKGSFEIGNVELASQYVELKADGFYFNEVTNSNSAAQLTLFALSDLSNTSSLNVNILSNLEKNRVSYLVSNGLSFSEAKKQALSEILSIFEIRKDSISESEHLDISKSGDDNAILLAISVILQGYLTVSDLSELLANISTDIREDGILNNQTLGSTLINNATMLKLATIRQNLERRYEELGVNINIPDFETYVNLFIDSTDYVVTNNITYPLMYDSRINMITDSSFILESETMYSISANIPIGRTLKICIKPSEGYDWGPIGYYADEVVGFKFHNYYPDSMILSAVGQGELVDCPAMFGESSRRTPSSTDYIIYEDDTQNPTRVKTVKIF